VGATATCGDNLDYKAPTCFEVWCAFQEALYGREVIVADREMVEQEVESILELAKTKEVAFLVVGDPFG
jgi:diphthamide biosynthesis methyltransferase